MNWEKKRKQRVCEREGERRRQRKRESVEVYAHDICDVHVECSWRAYRVPATAAADSVYLDKFLNNIFVYAIRSPVIYWNLFVVVVVVLWPFIYLYSLLFAVDSPSITYACHICVYVCGLNSAFGWSFFSLTLHYYYGFDAAAAVAMTAENVWRPPEWDSHAYSLFTKPKQANDGMDKSEHNEAKIGNSDGKKRWKNNFINAYMCSKSYERESDSRRNFISLHFFVLYIYYYFFENEKIRWLVCSRAFLSGGFIYLFCHCPAACRHCFSEERYLSISRINLICLNS